jgi:hypothetical protein
VPLGTWFAQGFFRRGDLLAADVVKPKRQLYKVTGATQGAVAPPRPFDDAEITKQLQCIADGTNREPSLLGKFPLRGEELASLMVLVGETIENLPHGPIPDLDRFGPLHGALAQSSSPITVRKSR